MSVTENSSSSLLFSRCHLWLGISKNGPYLLMSDDMGHTANVKDSEFIKKVHGFWVIQLKN